MCSKCQAVDDMGTDCEQCGKHTHVFWENKVGKFIDYLQLSRPFPDKIYIISHNSRGYDAQFLLRRFFGIEMGAWMNNGRYQNFEYVCIASALFEFVEFSAYESQTHDQIIGPHM